MISDFLPGRCHHIIDRWIRRAPISGDDLKDACIEFAKVAHVHTARGFRTHGIVRGLVPREVRRDHVAPSSSGES